MTRERTSYKRRSGTIPIGDYHAVTYWDRLLTKLKRIMGPSVRSRPVNAWYNEASNKPWSDRQGAAMFWLRGTFQATNLKGVSTLDGKRV